MSVEKLILWNISGSSLTCERDAITIRARSRTTTIPMSQIVNFEIKDPKGPMRPGLITIRLSGTSGTHLRMTSFLSVGGSNNLEFAHTYEGREIAHKIRRYISERQAAASAGAIPASAASASPADEIRKYKALMDDGIISAEEFEAKKRRLLGL